MSKSQLNQFPHSIGLAPQQAQGVRGMGPLIINFPGLASGALQTYSDDFNIEEMDGSINAIQSCWIDSTLMTLPALLVIQETGQLIDIPPNSQGFIPVFAMNTMTYAVSTIGATTALVQQLKLTFFNTPCSPGLWKVDTGLGTLIGQQSNAGNTTITTTPISGGSPPPGFQMYIDGFSLTGTGATAGGAVTMTIGQVVLSPTALGNVSIVVPVPTLPNNLNLEVMFPKPLMCGALKSGNSIQAQQPTFTVPAMGAGQTAVGLVIYWHLG